MKRRSSTPSFLSSPGDAVEGLVEAGHDEDEADGGREDGDPDVLVERADHRELVLGQGNGHLQGRGGDGVDARV